MNSLIIGVINRKSNVSYLKCVAFFSFIRLNNSHISSKSDIIVEFIVTETYD
jgi:hypothetical protein